MSKYLRSYLTKYFPSIQFSKSKNSIYNSIIINIYPYNYKIKFTQYKKNINLSIFNSNYIPIIEICNNSCKIDCINHIDSDYNVNSEIEAIKIIINIIYRLRKDYLAVLTQDLLLTQDLVQ